MRICMVEDGAGISQGLKTSLTQRGHAVDPCGDTPFGCSVLPVDPKAKAT
ncbi:MAG: hypothetical protein ABI589_13920 [Burkholderiales bacterium]